MIRQIKQRFNNIRLVSTLITTAETHANEMGEQKAGAEHLVLAAFDLPDGTARKSFEQVGADPAKFKAAIEQQYQDALVSIGVEPSEDLVHFKASKETFPSAKPSFRSVMLGMQKYTKFWPASPLLGATVIASAADQKNGVIARAIKRLGVDPERLKLSAESFLDSQKRH